MATNVTIAAGIQPSGTDVTSLFQAASNSAGVRIIAFAASLVSGSATYRVFIGTSATTASEVIPASPLTGPARETPGEIISQRIQPNESIFVQVSVASSITFRVEGIEF